MHFSEIYLQSNFQSHPGENPFLYKHIGIKVFLKEGDDLENAETQAQSYIQEYIKRNTQYPEHGHIELRDLPEIQKEEGSESLEELINNAPDIEALKSFFYLSKGNIMLHNLYQARLHELNNNQ